MSLSLVREEILTHIGMQSAAFTVYISDLEAANDRAFQFNMDSFICNDLVGFGYQFVADREPENRRWLLKAKKIRAPYESRLEQLALIRLRYCMNKGTL